MEVVATELPRHDKRWSHGEIADTLEVVLVSCGGSKGQQPRELHAELLTNVVLGAELDVAYSFVIDVQRRHTDFERPT